MRAMNARTVWTAVLPAALLGAGGALVAAVGSTPSGAPTHTAIALVGRIDARVDERMRAWRGESAIELAHALDALGGAFVLIPVGLATLLALAGLYRFGASVGLFAAWCFAIPLGHALKQAFERERPAGGLVDAIGFALPSGHTLAFSAWCVALAIGCARGRARALWLSLAFLAGCLMGFSRLVLSVHWASDALAGLLIGAGAALGCAFASEALERRLESRRARVLVRSRADT